MLFESRQELWDLMGLRFDSTCEPFGKEQFISHQTRDPKSGLLIALSADIEPLSNTVDKHTLNYERMMPDGSCYSHRLFEIETITHDDGRIGVKRIITQSRLLHDDDNPLSREDLHRVIAAYNRMVRLIRNKDNLENANQILVNSQINKVVGEKILLLNLSEDGGFLPTLKSNFKAAAGKDQNHLGAISKRALLNLLGFSRNTLEHGLDYAPEHRCVNDIDIHTSKRFIAHADIINEDDFIHCAIKVQSQSEHNVEFPFASASFKREGHDWYLEDIHLTGKKVDECDPVAYMPVIGVFQQVNQSFASRDYAPFMDAVAQSNLLDEIEPFSPPDPSKPYEFLYGSLHGTGMKKMVEHFGDQIGIASVFLNRAMRPDGKISTVGAAVDIPFATGGPESRHDGAVPNYLRFWPYISTFFITHDHFDHNGGLAIYAKAGMMKDKTVVCSDIVQRSCEDALKNLDVPRALWPTFNKPEDIMTLRDEMGIARLHVQSCENGTEHSAHTTPYIITPCKGDKEYGTPILVYGDATRFKDKAKAFFAEGAHALRRLKGYAYPISAPAIGAALHDTTAWKNEGFAPKETEVFETLKTVASLAIKSNRSPLFVKFSTNQREDKIILDTCHELGLDVTCVGANQERRFATMNACGVTPDLDLTKITIPDEDIPPEVWESAGEILDEAKLYVAKKLNKNPDADHDELMRRGLLLNLNKYRKSLIEDGVDIERSTHFFMLRGLLTDYKVSFKYNDVNNYLMYKAIMDGKDEAVLYRSRTSQTAKDWRKNASKMAIIATGPIGNIQQYFATLSKWVRGVSLLDADEEVRPTAFTVDDESLCPIIMQPAPVSDDEAPQAELINDIIRHKDAPVFAAFRDGFTGYNLQDITHDFIETLRDKKWSYRQNSDASISVLGQSIHIHGHGFREDCKENVRVIPAKLHIAHHIPDMQCFDLFNQDVRAMGFKTPDLSEPQDFVFYSMSLNPANDVDMVEKGRINPSYILFNLDRQFGKFYRGSVQLTVATLLRKDGHDVGNGLAVVTSDNGAYEQAMNPVDHIGPALDFQRARKTGPAPANRRAQPVTPRSRPFYAPPPGTPQGSRKLKVA